MNEDRLSTLLSAWQKQQLQGRHVQAAELCRDCPELAEELQQRIDALRQMNALLQPNGAPAGAAKNLQECATVAPTSSHEPDDVGRIANPSYAKQECVTVAPTPSHEADDVGRIANPSYAKQECATVAPTPSHEPDDVGRIANPSYAKQECATVAPTPSHEADDVGRIANPSYANAVPHVESDLPARFGRKRGSRRRRLSPKRKRGSRRRRLSPKRKRGSRRRRLSPTRKRGSRRRRLSPTRKRGSSGSSGRRHSLACASG